MSEDQIECPLCMDPLEIDDKNFFPCTCGYQICRFCWHRIRTDENGLCPACRKQYPEDPAEFKPLTEDELQRIKKEKRQKDLQRKQKAAENRKHLANVRVVQKNLVFVVGLSQRLAEPEVLRKHEYFGKFGKIHKVVINQSTSYAGAQGPSASAYVTYNKSEDALKAILAVNNVHVDGRTLKASLGTTKYCSHFLKGAQCPKSDCMYLHELGEEAASFTKEEMQMGKHQEYEQKLLEQFMNSQNIANNHVTSSKVITSRKKSSSPVTVEQSSPPQQSLLQQTTESSLLSTGCTSSTSSSSSSSSSTSLVVGSGLPSQQVPLNTASKDAWPVLNSVGGSTSGNNSTSNNSSIIGNNLGSGSVVPVGGKPAGADRLLNGNKVATTSRHSNHRPSTPTKQNKCLRDKRDPDKLSMVENYSNGSVESSSVRVSTSPSSSSYSAPSPTSVVQLSDTVAAAITNQSIKSISQASRQVLEKRNADSLSFFSGNGFSGNCGNEREATKNSSLQHSTGIPESLPSLEIPDTIPVTSATDWQAAFGFAPKNIDYQDDDLGFDPWDESSKALADLMEKENGNREVRDNQHKFFHLHTHPHQPQTPPQQQQQQQQLAMNIAHHQQAFRNNLRPQIHTHNIPPGFSIGHLQQLQQIKQQQQQQIKQQQLHQQVLRQDYTGGKVMEYIYTQPKLPQPVQNSYHPVLSEMHLHQGKEQMMQNNSQHDSFHMKDLQDGLRALLPNINISFGAPLHPQQQQQQQQQQQPSSSSACTGQQQTQNNPTPKSNFSHMPDNPHWMKSIQQLTEFDSQGHNHRLPFVQQFPVRGLSDALSGAGWVQQTHNPPPGFHTQIRPPTQTTEPHKVTEGLQ